MNRTDIEILLEVLYKSPISVFKKYGKDILIKLAKKIEVGRTERVEQYLGFCRERWGRKQTVVIGARKVSKLSKNDIENLIINEACENISCDNFLTYDSADLVYKMAYSQFGRAFHAVQSCHTAHEIYYNTLHPYEIWILFRVLNLKRTKNINTACQYIIDYLNENIRSKRKELTYA